VIKTGTGSRNKPLAAVILNFVFIDCLSPGSKALINLKVVSLMLLLYHDNARVQNKVKYNFSQ